MKDGLRIGGAGLLAIIAVVLLVLIGGAIVILSANFGGEVAKRSVHGRTKQQVFSPENNQAQVAFFHDHCRGVVRDFREWQNNTSQLKADERAARYARDPIRQQQAEDVLTQDQQNVTQVANVLQNDAQDYNSRSAQWTANSFKDAGLPDRIEPPSGDQLADWSPPNCN